MVIKLEERRLAMPLTTEDRFDIMDLVARYAECVDTGDAEGYAALFTPDGVVEHSAGSVRGRDEIRAWVADLAQQNRVGKHSKLKHIMGLPVIRGEGDRATSRVYVTIPRLMDSGEIVIRLAGTYFDDCVKQDGRWLFAKRLIDIDFVAT
jgi:ketosteroid isomerase-like protein